MRTQCLEGSYGIIIQEAKIIKIKYLILRILSAKALAAMIHSAPSIQADKFLIVSLLNTEALSYLLTLLVEVTVC